MLQGIRSEGAGPWHRGPWEEQGRIWHFLMEKKLKGRGLEGGSQLEAVSSAEAERDSRNGDEDMSVFRTCKVIPRGSARVGRRVHMNQGITGIG